MPTEIIRDIRKRCRMAMNGVASTSMRQKGLVYKINFGLNIQQIKDLSKNYQPNSALAETLWNEDTRELKILATLLYPTTEFTEQTAEKWVNGISNQEIREQVCLNLFQNLPYADRLSFRWSNSTNETIRTTGYWLLVRLFLAKKANQTDVDSFNHIWADAASENILLRNAALSALKHIGRQSKKEADGILQRLSVYKEDTDLIKQEAYNSLAFEFEYYFE